MTESITGLEREESAKKAELERLETGRRHLHAMTVVRVHVERSRQQLKLF